jgi:acetate kinase
VTAGRALNVPALNSGSSTLKFGLYRVDAVQTRGLIAGEAESIGESTQLSSQKDAVSRMAGASV